MQSNNSFCSLCYENQASSLEIALIPSFITTRSPRYATQYIYKGMFGLLDYPYSTALCPTCIKFLTSINTAVYEPLSHWFTVIGRQKGVPFSSSLQNGTIYDLGAFYAQHMRLFVYTMFWLASIRKHRVFTDLDIAPDQVENLRLALNTVRNQRDKLPNMDEPALDLSSMIVIYPYHITTNTWQVPKISWLLRGPALRYRYERENIEKFTFSLSDSAYSPAVLPPADPYINYLSTHCKVLQIPPVRGQRKRPEITVRNFPVFVSQKKKSLGIL